MEVLELIKQRHRMCDYYGDVSCVCDDSRETCPALNIDCSLGIPTSEQLVEIVEQWAKEHPEKPEQERQKPEQEQQKAEQDDIEGAIYREIISNKTRIEKLEYDVSVIRHNLAVLDDRIYALREKVDHTPTKEPSQTQEPKRTNKDVLLAAFPNTRMDDNGIPDVCPLALDTQFDCNGFTSCSLCKRTHWLKEDRVTQWRRRHKRCAFCRHIEYLNNPCGISAYKCRAKEKLVCEWLPRPFCGLYEVKIQKKDGEKSK